MDNDKIKAQVDRAVEAAGGALEACGRLGRTNRLAGFLTGALAAFLGVWAGLVAGGLHP